jgi:hypothetical protein
MWTTLIHKTQYFSRFQLKILDETSLVSDIDGQIVFLGHELEFYFSLVFGQKIIKTFYHFFVRNICPVHKLRPKWRFMKSATGECRALPRDAAAGADAEAAAGRQEPDEAALQPLLGKAWAQVSGGALDTTFVSSYRMLCHPTKIKHFNFVSSNTNLVNRHRIRSDDTKLLCRTTKNYVTFKHPIKDRAMQNAWIGLEEQVLYVLSCYIACSVEIYDTDDNRVCSRYIYFLLLKR